MELNEESLKRIYQDMINKTSEKSDNCPSDDILFNAIVDKQSQEDKFKIIDHVFECGYCNQRFNAFRDFYKESKKLTEGKENISISKKEVEKLVDRGKNIMKSSKEGGIIYFRKFPIRYVSTIAALLFIIIGSILFFELPNELEKSTHIDAVRGVKNKAVKLVSPKGSCKRKELIFKWISVKDADQYVVKLYNEELTCIWTSHKTKKTNLGYPSQLFKIMKKGSIYFWKVVIYTKNNELLKSKLCNFKLTK